MELALEQIIGLQEALRRSRLLAARATHEAEDLVQETMLRLLAADPADLSGSPDWDAVQRYAFTVLRTVVIDEHRKRAGRTGDRPVTEHLSERVPTVASTSPLESAALAEQRSMVRKAVERSLNVVERALVYRVVVERQPLTAVCIALKLEYGEGRGMLRRALKKLERILRGRV